MGRGVGFCQLSIFSFFFFNETATAEIYTLSLHDALPISSGDRADDADFRLPGQGLVEQTAAAGVDAVDVHVDEPSQLAGLIEEEIGQRKLAQGVADRGRLELEPLLPTRLGCER